MTAIGFGTFSAACQMDWVGAVRSIHQAALRPGKQESNRGDDLVHRNRGDLHLAAGGSDGKRPAGLQRMDDKARGTAKALTQKVRPKISIEQMIPQHFIGFVQTSEPERYVAAIEWLFSRKHNSAT